MVKGVEKRLFLRNHDGEIVPFDAAGLQSRIIGAFLAAGMREESGAAEDIVLALEYTLLSSPHAEPVFGQGEVDSAIIRSLEGFGFSEVAAAYRKGGPEQVVQISVAPEVLERLYITHLGCSPGRAAAVAATVAGKFATLDINAASPHLILEFGRHFEREMAVNDLPELAALPPLTDAGLSREKIYELLPAECKKFVDSGVLQINGITAILPSVRFFFFMQKFAVQCAWSKPFTELEVLPQLYRAGDILEAARRSLCEALALPEMPPCSLALPDITEFLHEYAGVPGNSALAGELTGALTAGLQCELDNMPESGK